VRHKSKWRVKSAGSSTTDPRISSSDTTIKDEVTRPIGRDRGKVAAWKGKGKGNEGSSSQSESSFVVDVIIFTLKKLSTSFVKAHLWR
jgi:hypothetical protein